MRSHSIGETRFCLRWKNLFLEGKTSKNKTPKMTPDFWKSYLQKKSESGSKDQITYRERTSKEVAPL